MRIGDRIPLHVDSLAFGGEAVGRSPDGVVFVARGVPGDDLEVRIEEAKRGWARGALLRVVSPGSARVAPRCPLVGVCGGCQWQAASIEAQRAAKQAIVERALGRLGATVEPLEAPSPPFGYRTRARFSVERTGERRAIGYAAWRSNDVVDVPACPLLDPALDGALGHARRVLDETLAHGASLAGLRGRSGVHLAVEGASPRVADRARSLVGEHGILGVLVDGQVIGDGEIDVADEGEVPFMSAADGFAQASAEGNRALRRHVASAAAARATGGRVLELYSGDGNFTRDLVRGAREVVAVEGARRAIARLPRNAPGALAVGAPVEEEAARRAAAGERFDLVVLDPPRTGARAVLPSLARLTDHVLYVSCDPMTLARDAAELAQLGLAPRTATAFDLTPQTFHVETVLELARAPR